MAGKIPQSFIEQLLARTDIVELIDSRVRLKKAGKNYQACCPFHNEKSPSFTVSQEKQFYHCFGCGAHGNAIGFLMEYDGLNFPDAIEELAAQFNIPVPREEGRNAGHGNSAPQPAVTADQYQLMEHASRFYQAQLRQSPTAIEYLKGRGLSGEIVKAYGIGYAPAGWDGLRQLLVRNREQEQQLVTLGMLIAKDQGGSYDRFRDRVMFPIRDRRGRIIAFGGRVLGDGTPKYLNSPETPIFHKGRELFGLFEAKEADRNPARLLIVEGYMDVVALAQFGIRYAVASLGTSTTADHMQLLFRATPEVICCYDGDNAGREAAWRALENALPCLQDGRSLKFVFLPPEHDPDSFVRANGREAFERYLDAAQPFGEFLFERLSRDLNLSGEAGQYELANKAAAMIRRVPEGFTREGLITRLSQHLRWGENERRLREIFARQEKEEQKPNPGMPKIKLTPVRRALALIIQHPQIAAQLPPLPDELAQLREPGISFLLQLLTRLRASPEATTAILLEQWRGSKEGEILAQLAMLDLFDSNLNQSPDILGELQDTLLGFINRYFEQRLSELQSRASQGTLSNDEKQELLLLLNETKQKSH
ncbi:DNA primase [Pseudaeromonas sharmana]|uniref:DNA primase n=1 Tax=Pseudaeromonas sharmana TaxID=328412 RepID=A0ABV8CRG6_9GAMM